MIAILLLCASLWVLCDTEERYDFWYGGVANVLAYCVFMWSVVFVLGELVP